MEKLKKIIKRKAFIYIALFVGCISLLFIGQERQYGIFAWIAPIFLLHYSRKAKSIQFLYLFLLLIVAGIITQKTHNHFNDPVFGLINGIAYAFIHFITYLTDRLLFINGRKLIYSLIFPAVYVVIEVLVTSVIGTSGALAQSQFSFAPFAQFSTITGIHGITFIICWFASIVYWLFENDFKPGFNKRGLISFGAVFIIILGFGFIRMATQSKAQKDVKVATISGPFDLQQLAEREKDVLLQLGKNPSMEIPASFFSNDRDISIQINNTRKAAEAGAKIIVWNEAALFLNQKQLIPLIAEIKDISKAFNAYILIAFYEESNSLEVKPINNKSILITKTGNIGWEYKKSHPTPAEIPLVNPDNSILPIIDTEYGKISTVICYDYDFPSLLKQANENKVNIMLVPAYDWKEFAHMHSKMAQFETLQSGRSLIRANGNGINMVTDNNGKVIADLNTFNSKDRILYANLPLHAISTVYADTGNVFVIFCIVCFILSIIFRVIPLLKSRKED
jgi:apolipoprotein N-acyltransferase